MAVLPTTSSTTDYISALQQSSDTSASAPNTVMGQEDFLMLLTTQLQNQDPSKPMDPTSFITDLTQMSQLEATTKMNESILAMTQSFQSLQTLQASSLIGKKVLVDGEDFSHTQDQVSQIRLQSDLPLSDVTIVISDENGLVKTISAGDLASGESLVDWDGLDEDGNSRASGVYSLTAYGTDEDGELQSINTIVASQVNSVGVNQDGSMTLTLATGEKVDMDSVREISA
ncbi:MULTISPECIES: flagellar hook assembly protein FlgD [Thiomicrorhabdus]|uniref:Basal-body rod modification protein FlgD n=1 Tax=Thiomicrorhabdus heinhorstiae TaxID=2748010 RepID=A0ABS0BY11_9GAMM|nr:MULTISPECIES: flagellar hook capping FlgD N-terminal domain-containing protein [Thiomicrorhabdus]MBF6058683.1 flagellar hook capping protein [Thiomicrorhabdus heinhorstiae]